MLLGNGFSHQLGSRVERLVKGRLLEQSSPSCGASFVVDVAEDAIDSQLRLVASILLDAHLFQSITASEKPFKSGLAIFGHRMTVTRVCCKTVPALFSDNPSVLLHDLMLQNPVLFLLESVREPAAEHLLVVIGTHFN